MTSLLPAAVDLLRAGDSCTARLANARISIETIVRDATKTTHSPPSVHRLANPVVDAAIVFTHAWVVPKQSKTQKARRDEGIIAGLRKYFGKDAVLYLAGKAFTRNELIASSQKTRDLRSRAGSASRASSGPAERLRIALACAFRSGEKEADERGREHVRGRRV